MDFALSQEQEMLRKTARDFLEKNCSESLVRQMEADEKGYPPGLWRDVAGLGWLGIALPEKYGGTGGNLLDLTVLCEELGRAMFPGPFLSTAVLGSLCILTCGSEQQKSDLLPRIAKGELLLSLALTEPSARWDAEGVSATARLEGDHYSLSGTKLFVHDAHIADYLLCAARTSAGRPEDGVSLFLVDRNSPGVSVSLLKTVSMDNKQSEVVLDNVKVPGSQVLGKVNEAWAPLFLALQVGAVMVCADLVGAGQKALELAVDYAKTRVQFEQPIGVNQFIHEHCIQMLSEVDGSRFLTYQAAWRLSEGMSADMEVAAAKSWVSDAMELCFRHAHAVFAGIGIQFPDHVLPLYTRRALVAQSYLGDAAFHRKQIARQMDGWKLEMPRGRPLGLWTKEVHEQTPCWQR